ncbi:DUF6495 family protein [Flavobacterium urocaniciphilum]|uniref:Histidyl-tRNA synthetase n=1 Tax=Flavobacterium urocaniciphilum TaxID=1299341 RepID=A0A1H9DA10_9FLAO|nr:DUF6495 family protein [Flavobacterium urocaniciphilum]SEQ10181.1 hypothetical protein SAMN05444005_106115 [Flavobacterium urocaniciphilum]
MKYTRLTKEQLEELHPEFVTFLATQSIDKKEWDEIKTNKPEIALQEIDVFSDMIWDKAITNVRFIDHFSKNHIFLFKCHDTFLESLIIQTSDHSVDFFTAEGLEWLGDNLFGDSIMLQTGKKEVPENRNEEVFKIIENGGIISKGELYTKLIALIKVS